VEQYEGKERSEDNEEEDEEDEEDDEEEELCCCPASYCTSRPKIDGTSFCHSSHCLRFTTHFSFRYFANSAPDVRPWADTDPDTAVTSAVALAAAAAFAAAASCAITAAAAAAAATAVVVTPARTCPQQLRSEDIFHTATAGTTCRAEGSVRHTTKGTPPTLTRTLASPRVKVSGSPKKPCSTNVTVFT
jgi:hypothetical protein